MGYTSNVQTLMAICVIMMMTGAGALPHAHPEKALNNPRTHKTSKESTGSDTLTVSLHIDPKDLVPSRPIRPIENHSTSPWTYNVTNDDSRFPRGISEVRCTLQGCLNFEGKEDRSLESKPIYHQIIYLRKMVGSEENYVYKLESKVIAVGCTCVMPSVQHQQ
ncbi:hypothetical protein UPYG_G00230880 [Umbra pygmaea]|uniref:Uncharacterized protein n=1 Tax=Umbra pygmaea TaxID=75934 RepID=A0ABD0WZJ3_UMBPY